MCLEQNRALFQPEAYRVRDLSTEVEQFAMLHDTGQISLFIQAKDGTIARITKGDQI